MIPDKLSEKILFHFEDIQLELLHPQLLILWLNHTIETEKKTLSFLNYIFCSDEYLHSLNMQYLNHDTLTDVITFPYSYQQIEGDIFISIDRIKDNANAFNVSMNDELHRVMVHGLLHLLGFGDKNDAEKILMRKKENQYLQDLNGMILDKA